MVMIRRSKPAAGEAAGTAKRVTLRRGVATGRTSANAAQKVKDDAIAIIEENLKLISNNDAAIDAAVASNDQAYAAIKSALEVAQMDGYTNGRYQAEIKTPMGRESREIDVKKFQKAVSADDFYACVKIGVTEAKKVLSEKELDKISKITPAKTGDPILKIERIVVKTTKTKV